MPKKFNPKVADHARKLIGNFVKDHRNELGWSQNKLADMADIRKATLIDVELGRNYNINTLLAILGCMRGELFIEWHDIESMLHFGKPGKN